MSQVPFIRAYQSRNFTDRAETPTILKLDTRPDPSRRHLLFTSIVSPAHATIQLSPQGGSRGAPTLRAGFVTCRIEPRSPLRLGSSPHLPSVGSCTSTLLAKKQPALHSIPHPTVYFDDAQPEFGHRHPGLDGIVGRSIECAQSTAIALRTGQSG